MRVASIMDEGENFIQFQGYRPREGCGLRQKTAPFENKQNSVTVPVRGAGCVVENLLSLFFVLVVTVPVRGAGCVSHTERR